MNRKSKLSKARNYLVYYGRKHINQLSKTDVAIVEPAALDDSQIQKMQNKGTMVIAYLSFLEIPRWSSLIHYLNHDDFIQIEGIRLTNPEYDNYCADLSSAKWQRILLHKVSELLTLRCFDGVFIDTIGFLEYDQIPLEIRDTQIRSAQGILKIIRESFPEHILIQNGGLSNVIYATKTFIDGLCWENPPLERQERWIQEVADHLAQLQDLSGLKVFLLFENTDIESPQYIKAQELGQKNNFLLFNAANSYTNM